MTLENLEGKTREREYRNEIETRSEREVCVCVFERSEGAEINLNTIFVLI